jgi:hypothetical protein
MPPAPTPATRAAAAPASSARRPNIAEIYFPVTLLLIGALLGSLYWISQRYASANGVSRPESQTPAHTGFSANRDGAAWKLTWDSAAVEALKPTGATLSIQDGAGEQDIPLTTADLFSGTVYYTPKNGDLAFRFEVRRGLATVAEGRVRVVEGIKQVPVSSPANPVRQTTPALVSAPNGGGARIFIPPKANSRQVESAPILTEAAPLAGTSVPEPSLPPGFKAPPAPAPVTPAPSPPATPPQAQPAPPAGAPAASVTLYNYVAPRAIKQVQAPVEFGARRNGMIQVQVLVAIDAKGKVIKATSVGPIADVRLVAAATKSAEFWEFEPARLNGQAIASEMTLIFRF